jgi:hypothetical protein
MLFLSQSSHDSIEDSCYEYEKHGSGENSNDMLFSPSF